MNDADLVELINHAVEVAVERVQRSIVQPQFLVGTIIELDASGTDIHEVLMDGDDQEVAAMDVTNITFNPAGGDRVAIVFTPPHQFWIIGIIP